MIAAASLTGPVPKIWLILVAVLAGGVLVLTNRRQRAGAMIVALVLAPALLLASIWDDARLRPVRDHPLPALVAVLFALAVLAAAALWLRRRWPLFGLLAVLTLPFRVPISLGGTTSNLLVPLYAVIGVGALAWVMSVFARERSPYRSRRDEAAALAAERAAQAERAEQARREGAAPRERPLRAGDPALLRWLAWLLAASVVLYAVQASYSTDFQKALQYVVFFYVPFAVLYSLLREIRWTPGMLRAALLVAVGLGIAFSLVGFVEYATRTIFLNPKLITTNNTHVYFTVNSLFYDPNIFGRYLSLTMILLVAGLLYRREGRALWATIGALALMWACLCLTLSRTSLAALLLGLAVLAALRWKPSRALVIAVVVIIIGAAAVAASPHTFGLEQGFNGVSGGRGGLVSGGISLFEKRPGWGYGSGSFSTEYHAGHPGSTTTDSHTIPITIAAEQGLIGLLVYASLLVCAFTVVTRRSRGDPVRSAIAAAFVALMFHTLLYANFLEDPTTWALLAVGAALAAMPRRGAMTAEEPLSLRTLA
ncbi:MAG TPA: O-antigen ligase family protein [Solirubrobacteraceae bacterium]|nr:O-antigen ligase family protein [Solirubrobacteraceae bacterium]